MACNDIVSAILHYKRNIDKISDPPERALKYEDRLLHCINKLYKLPVNVNHLQETGVGRTVNSLRKIEGEKGLGDAAKALVAKWKTMVMLEDEAERKQREECSGPSEEDINRIKIIREAEKSELRKTESSPPKSPHESRKRSHESSKKHRSESADTSKSKKRKHESEGDDKNHSKRRETHSSDLEGTSYGTSEHKDEKSKSKSHSSSSSSSKNNDKSSHKSSSSHKSHESSKEERRKEKDSYNSKSSSSKTESSSSKHSESSSKSHKKHESRDKDKDKKKKVYENDGFDSQSGASFADALGPIVVKKSPKKKGGHSSTVSSPAPSDYSSESSGPSVKEKKKDAKDLLFSQPKLEPLEPDLVATLPVPTPYYKPHPSYIPTQEAVKKRVQAEEDALTMVMSNKNSRTKVYSGVKGGLSYVPSLYECCCRVLQQHIDALEYTGGIPFSLLKPVLEGASPSQLYQFEHFNPYIIEDTDDLWKFHVNKEFRSEKRQEFESWRDMYLRCVDEREEKYKAVTANIMQKTIQNSIPVRKAKLAYIDVAKPPRNILKKQIKNGTAKPDSSRLLGKNDPEAVKVSAPKQPTTREPAVIKVKPKIAPLMQKTLKSIKMSRFKRR